MEYRQDGQSDSADRSQRDWYCVRLSMADVARNWHGILLDRFETFFRALRGPEDMAMFITPMDSNGVTLYFSPATGVHAPTFIRLANAAMCDRPGPPVTQIAGHPAAG